MRRAYTFLFLTAIFFGLSLLSAYSFYKNIDVIKSPAPIVSWSEKAGAGYSVPACNSAGSPVTVTCNPSTNRPRVTLRWYVCGFSPNLIAGISRNPLGDPACSGVFSPSYWPLPCSGSLVWDGLENNTSYYANFGTDYHLSPFHSGFSYCGNQRYEVFPFTTPNCTPTPTVSISANPSSIYYNTASTITWSSTNASSCYINYFGWVPTSGSSGTGNLVSSRTYSITCYGSGGSASSSATVSVGGAPSVSIYADRTSLYYNTGTTVRWSSSNVSSCTISPAGWTGVTGAQWTGNLTSSQTYTANCSAPGGSVSGSVAISVGGPPTLDFSADSSAVPYNTATTLRWSSANTTYCVASGDWYEPSMPLSGSQSTGALTSPKTYTMTCGGPGANISKSVTVAVIPGNFSLATPTVGGGSLACNSVSLSWTASGGAAGYRILRGTPRVDISPYQPYTALNYSDASVSQNTEYIYQIEAYNGSGSTRSNSVNVTTPYCSPTLTITPAYQTIFIGQNGTVTWSSAYTSSCSASGSWSGSRPTSGTETFESMAEGLYEYILSCVGINGTTVSGSATIKVSNPSWREILPR